MNDDPYLLIDGRRWRRSDPGIPDALRSELVAELMRARRAVGSARRSEDPEAERTARAHVHDAKVALGERGPRWWEPLSDAQLAERARAAMHALLRHRGADKTICPSDVARTIGGQGWRARMQVVRETAQELARAGALELRQRGKPVGEALARGPIRIGVPRAKQPKRCKAPPER